MYVEELVDGTRTQTGAFCTYGCLAAHIEHEGLATGTTCRVEFE
ncbi:hypothetical protein C499_10389 [Halogeometricum borinquense DSM 11551]|uniref:Uncharacterized protein n=1 Tax=Halogeometricum borinquense (strain ATCC 700274 / DSM 11551 / JCM 10706 / KCTC 4070 / PR3) TaxID=469382 RepID=L9URD3_HALBP|nr:hypothetical protein C499_10389 [Halogeometricum borinquense DSM 11551]